MRNESHAEWVAEWVAERVTEYPLVSNDIKILEHEYLALEQLQD